METMRKKAPLNEQDEYYAKLDAKHSRIEDVIRGPNSQINMWAYGHAYSYDNDLYDTFIESYYDTE